MQHRGRKCRQGRKCNTEVENVVKVDRKCNFKILNAIKLENATLLCIIQCREKYIIVRTKYRGD